MQANKQDIGPCLIYFLRRDFFDPFTGGNIVHFGNLGGGDIDRKISVYWRWGITRVELHWDPFWGVSALKGCSIHCSIECKPWSQWQHLNKFKYPKLASRIRREQLDSEALVQQFIRVANVVLDNGGDVSYEWPRFCTGWSLPVIQAWILQRNLHSATFNGCTVGVVASGTWRRIWALLSTWGDSLLFIASRWSWLHGSVESWSAHWIVPKSPGVS